MNKRIVAAGLSCLLAISTAITSFAAGNSVSGSGGVNGGGSGSSKQPSTIEYISSMHEYQINSGIQCSIV